MEERTTDPSPVRIEEMQPGMIFWDLVGHGVAPYMVKASDESGADMERLDPKTMTGCGAGFYLKAWAADGFYRSEQEAWNAQVKRLTERVRETKMILHSVTAGLDNALAKARGEN